MAITIREGRRIEIIPPRITSYAARKMAIEKKPTTLLKKIKNKKIIVKEI
jgi:hypothetical protein